MIDEAASSAGTDKRVGGLLRIGAVWAGSGALGAIPYALLPLGAMLVAGNQADLLVGRVIAAGNLVVLAMPIAAGALSDRTVSRWGRRTPWLVVLSLVTTAGLLLLGLAAAPVVLVLSFLVYQVGASGTGGIFTAILPDLVPIEARGLASGLLSTMLGVGGVASLAMITGVLLLRGENHAGLLASYGLLAVIVLAATAITVTTLRERPSVRVGRVASPSAPLWVSISRFLSALRDRDFAWSAVNRALFNFGYFSVQPFVAFYFKDVGRSSRPATSAAIWALFTVLAAVGPAILGGRMSDRIRRRKPFLYMSGAGQAIVVSVMVIGLPYSPWLAYGDAAVFGVFYGLYYAVDLALACDVLPDRLAAGRDMGIWHAALTVPAVLAPAIAAPVLHFFNQPGQTVLGLATGSNLGYRVVFLSAAAWFVLGTLAVTQIRRVR